jgi:hypothetical protein
MKSLPYSWPRRIGSTIHPHHPRLPHLHPHLHHIEIDEQKVFAQLGPREDEIATDGCSTLRPQLSPSSTPRSTGLYTSGDRSVVEIKGRRTIVFTCKNREHNALTRAYFIPRLTVDIISLGQLIEVGCQIIIDPSAPKIYEPGRKLLARVIRSPSHLYMLEFNISRPVRLSAQNTEAAWCWHARYGHINFQSLRCLANHDMVCSLLTLEQVEQVCGSFLSSKH